MVQNHRKAPKPEKVFISDTATFHDYSQSMTGHEKRALFNNSVADLFLDDGFNPHLQLKYNIPMMSGARYMCV